MINEPFSSLIGDDKLVGAVTLLARQGQIEEVQAYGYLNRETHPPMPVDAIFRIYSMTKPITSVALLMMVDRGLVGLDDGIVDYLPAFSNPKILKNGTTTPSPTMPTIAGILTHSAGFDYRIWETEVAGLYRTQGVWDLEKSLADTIDILATLPLAYEPSTSWQYSVSPDVSAHIVEVVSGKPFDQFLQDEIFAPLGMVDTGFFVPAAKHHRFTSLYGSADWAQSPVTGRILGEAAQRGEHHLIATAENNLESTPHHVIRGGTGLVTTAQDYFRFCQMLLNGGELNGTRLLQAKTVQLATQNQLPPEAHHHFTVNLNQPGQGFGFGFRVMLDKPAVGNVGEFSWWGAANTSFWVDPGAEIVGVQMSQYMPPNVFPAADVFKASVYRK